MHLSREAIQSNARVFGVDEPMTVGGFEYKVPLSDGKNGLHRLSVEKTHSH
jgi:hypothetical protein